MSGKGWQQWESQQDWEPERVKARSQEQEQPEAQDGRLPLRGTAEQPLAVQALGLPSVSIAV